MILSLDFDGVLHTFDRMEEALCRLPLLAARLRTWPGVDVVISSSWRTAFALSELVWILGPQVGARVVGCTPVLPRSTLRRFVLDGREQEIGMWLRASWQSLRPWVALDGMSELFFPGSPGLLLCDVREGLSAPVLAQQSGHVRRAVLVPAFDTGAADGETGR